MLKRSRLPLLVICAVSTCGFTQVAGAPTAVPQIIIDLPDNIPPEAVWVRYALYGGSGGNGSRGEALKTKSNSHHYITVPYAGAPARHGRVVIYAPGCQFAMYELDLASNPQIRKQFQCNPLVSKTVHGFLHPDEIPPNIGVTAEKKLDITGYLDGDWVCRFFFQPWPESTSAGGSCLGSAIPLGTVGQLDPGRNGVFEVTIPDFTCDPVFGKFARQGKFGVIDLALKQKQSGRFLGGIKAGDSPEKGLNVQEEYPDPVMFTTVHD